MRQTSSHKLGLMFLRHNFTSPIQNLCISKHSSRSKAQTAEESLPCRQDTSNRQVDWDKCRSNVAAYSRWLTATR